VVAFRNLDVNHRRVAGHVQHSIICQSTVKANFDIILPFSSVVPSVWKTTEAQVRETRIGDHVTEPLHHPFATIIPSKLFMIIQNFVKISRTQPREIRLIPQKVKHSPRFFTSARAGSP
jgi:hypothetical protein